MTCAGVLLTARYCHLKEMAGAATVNALNVVCPMRAHTDTNCVSSLA